MTVKEWLSRGYKIDREINALLSEHEEAFALACKVSAPPSDNEKVSATTGNGSEARFIKYADYSKLIDRRIDELYRIKSEIMTVITLIDNNTYRTLLIMRYVQFKTWEQIAEGMGYDLRWIYRVHKKALNTCEKSFKRWTSGEKLDI